MERPSGRERGPFLVFTDFETNLLEALVSSKGSDEPAMRQQLASAKIVSRENTIVGFYTKVAVDPETCPALPAYAAGDHSRFNGGGGHIDTEGFEHGLGFVVWFKAGYFDCIECYTYGVHGEMPAELEDLKAISVLLG